MTYVFDIDGTICSNTGGDYDKAEPLQERIDKINQLHADGHVIVFQTARGMGRSGNSFVYAHEAFYDLTRQQLLKWGVKFDSLFLGKPAGDFYIDDKGISDGDFFTD